MKPKELKAIDLINMLIEFKVMQKDKDTWEAEKLKDNPPRYYRFLRISALCKAFLNDNSKENICGFENGNFLKDSDTIFDAAANFIVANSRGSFEAEKVKNSQTAYEFQAVFERLFRFKQELTSLKNFNSSVWAASFPYLATVEFTNNVTKSIAKNHEKVIDDLLELIVNPDNKSFTEQELIEQFDYPRVNLSNIDDDWW